MLQGVDDPRFPLVPQRIVADLRYVHRRGFATFLAFFLSLLLSQNVLHYISGFLIKFEHQ
jgi:hypothetical protein